MLHQAGQEVGLGVGEELGVPVPVVDVVELRDVAVDSPPLLLLLQVGHVERPEDGADSAHAQRAHGHRVDGVDGVDLGVGVLGSGPLVNLLLSPRGGGNELDSGHCQSAWGTKI